MFSRWINVNALYQNLAVLFKCIRQVRIILLDQITSSARSIINNEGKLCLYKEVNGDVDLTMRLNQQLILLTYKLFDQRATQLAVMYLSKGRLAC